MSAIPYEVTMMVAVKRIVNARSHDEAASLAREASSEAAPVLVIGVQPAHPLACPVNVTLSDAMRNTGEVA